MKAPYRKTPLSLCVSTLLVAALMCLFRGGHYAAQLEEAWPSPRPLAEFLSNASDWSGLSKAHGFFKDKADVCCHALWSTQEEAGEEIAAEGVAVEPTPAPPAPEFRNLHERWLGRNGVPVYEFRAFHCEWLNRAGEPQQSGEPRLPAEDAVADASAESTPGRDDTPAYEFSAFHQEWLGREEAEKLVDSCPVNCRVLLMGDSLMEDFGVFFYQHVKSRRGLQMILLAKFSTGLCRPDYFNWFELFPSTLDEKKPHIVLFMIGANDGQPVWYSKGNVVQTRPGDQWKSAYGGRVGTLLDDAAQRCVLPLWVGMPVMGCRYAALLAQTEEATREECARRNVPYVDNRALLADEHGAYQSFIRNESGKMVRVRRKDKEHMAPEGNRMLVRAAMADFERLLRQHRLNHPELCAYPEQKEALARPSLDIVIPYKPAKK